jgi:O-antigen/teichoic acid export membrane protein
LLTQITNVWSAQHDIGILVQKRTEWVAAANWVAALVALCGYSLFVPRYLAWGAAAVTLASCVLRHIVIYVASQRLMPVRYSWAPVARLALISLGTWTVALAIPTLPIVFSVLVNGSLLGVYLFAIWHAGVLTEVERAQVLRFLRTMPGRASLLSACGAAQKQKRS